MTLDSHYEEVMDSVDSLLTAGDDWIEQVKQEQRYNIADGLYHEAETKLIALTQIEGYDSLPIGRRLNLQRRLSGIEDKRKTVAFVLAEQSQPEDERERQLSLSP